MKLTNILASSIPALALTAGVTLLAAPIPAHAEDPAPMAHHGTMHVTKSPTCGCCGAWVALAREEGFAVDVTDTPDVTSAKLGADVPGPLWSCHTAKIGGYVVEGHVPFDAIRKLLDTRPDIAGISVPGMPMGSPGMGDDPDARYDVIAFGGEAGTGEVFLRAGQ